MIRMPNTRLLAALSVTTALFAAPASAQILSDWDMNNDGLLTEREFVRGATEEGYFSELDFDEDGVIDRSEFNQIMYQLWDQDGDGTLSLAEWDTGFDTWFGEGSVNLDPNAWDRNGDGIVTQSDFNRGMRNLGVFQAIEANADDDSLIGPATGQRQAMQDQTMQRQAMQRQDMQRMGRQDQAMQRRDRGNRVVNLVSLEDWDYENLRGGFSGENLMDAEVIGRNGEEIGEVENIILSADNAIQTLIIEVGDGFLGIGGTRLAVPWDQTNIRMSGAEVTEVLVPVTEGNYDRYSALGEFGYGFAEDEVALGDRTGGIYRVEDEVTTRGGTWKASNLMGDYTTLADDVAYGYVDDLIFDEYGTLTSVVVEPDPAYGTGPYAYPFTAGFGFSPALDYYGLPYSYDQVGALDPFDYGYLDPGL